MDTTDLKEPLAIYIYKAKNSCLIKGHDLEPIRALVIAPKIQGKIEIAIARCPQCNKYFIDLRTVTAYEEKYGCLLFQRHEDDDCLRALFSDNSYDY